MVLKYIIMREISILIETAIWSFISMLLEVSVR